MEQIILNGVPKYWKEGNYFENLSGSKNFNVRIDYDTTKSHYMYVILRRYRMSVFENKVTGIENSYIPVYIYKGLYSNRVMEVFISQECQNFEEVGIELANFFKGMVQIPIFVNLFVELRPVYKSLRAEMEKDGGIFHEQTEVGDVINY